MKNKQKEKEIFSELKKELQKLSDRGGTLSTPLVLNQNTTSIDIAKDLIKMLKSMNQEYTKPVKG